MSKIDLAKSSLTTSKPILLLGYGRLGRAVRAYLDPNISTIHWSYQTPSLGTNHLTGDFLLADLKSLPKFSSVFFSCSPTDSSKEAYERCYLSILNRALRTLDYKHFILCSSSAVYGDCKGAWVHEESEVTGSSFRAEVLLKAEQLVRDNSMSSYQIMRLSGLYDSHFIPPESWLKNHQWANRIHLKDAGKWCAQALLHSEKTSGIYILSDDYPFIPADIAQNFSLCKKNFAFPTRPLESKKLSNLKAKSFFGNNLLFPSIYQGLASCVKEKN